MHEHLPRPVNRDHITALATAPGLGSGDYRTLGKQSRARARRGGMEHWLKGGESEAVVAITSCVRRTQDPGVR